jgi:type IV secretion system protein VirB8
MDNQNIDLDKTFDQMKEDSNKQNTKELNELTDTYLSAIKSFESDSVELAKKEARIYKKVSITAVLVAVLAIGALAASMPFKTVEPYVLRVDDATGYVSAVRPLKDAQSITYGEVLDKHWLSNFMVARNGYEWETVQNSFNTVKVMSTDKVFGAYSNYIQGKQSPTETFVDKKIINVKVHGVSFLPRTSTTEVLAQVQFTRSIENGRGLLATGYKPTRWTATVTFDYKAKINTEDERRLNPLGFQVTSYREDRILNK